METIQLGRTGLTVTRTGFGVLPIQRTAKPEAIRILRRAVDAGITFYDTARGYTDSEEKLGAALSDRRSRIVLATKSFAATRRGLLSDLEASLRNLNTDFVDILQLHNPVTLPDPADPESPYAGLVQARQEGKIRFLGITNHSLDRALAAADSGLYDTIQFPLSSISSRRDLSIVDQCRDRNLGLIAMKPLCGGLLTNSRTAFAFLRQYPNVIPIWGMQTMEELEDILDLDAHPPPLDESLKTKIERDRRDLGGDFCRACGYCLPCPADIPIPMAARMPLLLRRMPWQPFAAKEWRDKMDRIRQCTACGHCKAHCPYGLDTPELLRKALTDYEAFCQTHTA